MPNIILPHNPTLQVLDRFDILQSDSDTVPFWSIVRGLLSQSMGTIAQLIDAIETLSMTLHGQAKAPNFELFRRVFKDDFMGKWPFLRDLALELPEMLPTELAVLSSENRSISFSRRQVACLVIHQFLCTLPKPPWMSDGSQDFSVWFSSPSPHKGAVGAYLRGLRKYFEYLPLEEWPLTLRSTGDIPTHKNLLPLEVVLDPTSEVLLGLPSGASVISANKDVGFGRTASQEEMVVGASPELCPVVLFAPTLQDEDVVVVQGTQATISLSGYARTAHLDRFIDKEDFDWRQRTVLFMDALELDGYESVDVPDLLPGNVHRELQKAYTAFSAKKDDGSCFNFVETGLWGCRSFGGNRYIKTLIQWAAASFAEVRLKFICRERPDFAQEFREFVNLALSNGWTADQMVDVLVNLTSMDIKERNVFAVLAEKLS